MERFFQGFVPEKPDLDRGEVGERSSNGAVTSDKPPVEVGKAEEALESLTVLHSSTPQTFSWSILILPVEMMYPRIAVEAPENFSAFTNRRFSRSQSTLRT